MRRRPTAQRISVAFTLFAFAAVVARPQAATADSVAVPGSPTGADACRMLKRSLKIPAVCSFGDTSASGSSETGTIAVPTIADANDTAADVVRTSDVKKPSTARNWILTGYLSKHFGPQPELDDNYGGFFEHDFRRQWGFVIGEYKNSGRIESRMLAARWQPLNAGGFGVGILAGFVDGYVQLNNSHFAPGGLPYVSFETRGVKADMICVPPVIKTAEALCSIQLGINLGNSTLGL